MGGTFVDVFPIISNLWFLLPFYRAFKKGRYIRMVFYLGIVINSSIYHTCNGFSRACFINADFHRKMDFWFAMMIIPLDSLYIIFFDREDTVPLEIFTIFFYGLATLYVQQVVRDSIFVQLFLTASSLFIILAYWTWYYMKNKDLPPYDWGNMFLAVLLTSVACMLYVAEMADHYSYWSIHSLWHIIAAYAQYFLLDIRPGLPTKNTPGLYDKLE